MAEQTQDRWLVRLTPLCGRTIGDLFKVPLSLDVWEREADALVAAVSEHTIAELERRRLAGVERLRRTVELERNALAASGGGGGGSA